MSRSKNSRIALKRVLAALAGALGVLALGPASAATGGWSSTEIVPGEFAEARLVAAVDGTGDLAAVPAGLQLRLDDGWKTYWRSPGDAGLPPTVDWTGSSNVADVAWRWPAPHRFTLFGLDTFGYADEIVFPLEVTPVEPGAPMTLAGRLDLLVCTDICVPVTLDLALDLPAGPAAPDARAANLIDRYASLVPGDGAAAGLSIERVAAIDAADGAALRVEAAADEPLVTPDIFVEAGDGWTFGAPRIRLGDGGRSLSADLPVVEAPAAAAPDRAAALAGLPVRLTLVDGARAAELESTAAPAGVDTPRGTAAGGLLAMLGLALLGGLILNLMPCVLPVLSLKLLAILGQGGQPPARIRLGFLASAAGILASFLVLAGAAVTARAAGATIGWGIQFQQPIFLGFMIVLLTLFACNLLGLFEIRLPSALATGVGRIGRDDRLFGHFATGAFAALLATPCSAPFLGTAVGFALSRGPVEIVAIFAALGIGLALPYLLVAAVPRLAARLPRPGAWMITVRRLLSLALIATALWLLSVLAVQQTNLAAAVIGASMVGLGAILWGRRHLAGGVRLASSVGAGVLAAAALAAPLHFGSVADARPAAATAWVGFDRPAIARLVESGRTVFVDVTADWCLTCQVNERLVLGRGAVAESLAGDAVVAMRADWTSPDQEIAEFLADHGRYGIPFYIVYGPGAPDGIMLPELLTEARVLGALDAAALASSVASD